MKTRTPAKDRALFLKERALDLVQRQGSVERIANHGVARAYHGAAFRIWYADPETSECDEFHHLDVWDNERKVLSVVWLPLMEHPEVVSFKRGHWEAYFLS
jgi:hypothetical protein